MYREFRELIGRKVESLGVADNAVCFVTDKGVTQYRVDGDCCSESWFADVFDAGNLIGHTVERIADSKREYSADDGRCRQEVDSVYAYDIVTEAGACTIVYRNSSNGYYGGDLSMTFDGPVVQGQGSIERVHVPDVSAFKWVESDWKNTEGAA